MASEFRTGDFGLSTTGWSGGRHGAAVQAAAWAGEDGDRPGGGHAAHVQARRPAARDSGDGARVHAHAGVSDCLYV